VSISFPALRRGLRAGLLGVAVLTAAAFPSRLSVAIRGWGSVLLRAERALAGMLLDLGAIGFVLVPLVVVLAVLVPLLVAKLRDERWQRVGGVVAALPLGLVIWVLTVLAQEVKSERGSFPTVFDLAEGGTNASFVQGTLGFIRYQRIWLPALPGIALAAVVVVLVARGAKGPVLPWRPWAGGLVMGLLVGVGAVWLAAFGLGTTFNALSPAAIGDPLTGLVESAVDLLRARGPATARELVLDIDLPSGSAALGAQRLGWPVAAAGRGCAPHPYARPLDTAREPRAPGRALVEAFERVSQTLFAGPANGDLGVFLVSLEGFRADDVHALNPLAPRAIAPFTTSLYEKASAAQNDGHKAGHGVLASTHLFQGGVRTAHCLGAMTCGLGTLPYNLSFIRDLQPFPVRCMPDVLADAGFHHSFFYGSDGTFDAMDEFLRVHRFETVMAQKDLPTNLPLGTWDGITDFAVFDAAVAHAVKTPGAQFTLLMSLSNHSPFTTPQDMPAEVVERVDVALKTEVNRADVDDRRRLMTYSYTDAALERLFAKLDETGLAERSVVIFMADHSTGHTYVWGREDPESDAEKTQIPFVIVVPERLRAKVADIAALDAALASAQTALESGAVSQNDVPTLLLALLSAHPGVKALPAEQRWHTLGGQITSPWFVPGGDERTSIIGINGVSELYSFDRRGVRVGDYEDSVFLKTRADRYRVTPRLIPVAATLAETMKRCAPSPAP
jgi:Sulfatase